MGELADLFYHIIVLTVDKGGSLEDVNNELHQRSKKVGNLKAERKKI